MTNQELAAIFRRIGDLLEFKGEVVYKIAAYRRAARTTELGSDRTVMVVVLRPAPP